MELGALVVTHGLDANRQIGKAMGIWGSTWPVLGRTVLDRWIERVRGLGVGLVSVVDQAAPQTNRMHTMIDWAREGVEQILLILMGSYADVDLTDLVRFHHQGQHRITRVFDPQGPLGISLLNGSAVLNKENAARLRAEQSLHSSRYDFLGYAVRLSSTVAYRRLVQDALAGRCGIQPAGLQASDNAWIHPTAHLDPTVRLDAPCYIGARTRLNAGVVVQGSSSVEHNCEIDIGTTLDHASVLPDTYVAPGLCLRQSVLDGTHLENLDRGVTVDIGTLGLSARRTRAATEERARQYAYPRLRHASSDVERELL